MRCKITYRNNDTEVLHSSFLGIYEEFMKTNMEPMMIPSNQSKVYCIDQLTDHLLEGKAILVFHKEASNDQRKFYRAILPRDVRSIEELPNPISESS